MNVGVFGDSELAAEIRQAVVDVRCRPAALATGDLHVMADRLDVLLAPLSWARNGGLERAAALDLPVVVVVTNPDQDVVRQVTRRGAKGVVTVPFEPEQLLAQLRVATRLQRVDRERMALDARVGRLEKAYAVAADPLFFLDFDGRIAEVNPAASDAYAMSEAELLGQLWGAIGVDPAAREALLERLGDKDVLRHGRIQRLSGGDLVECVLHRVRGELGEPAGTLVFERDLSEIQELKDAIALRQEALELLERRNAELERFTYTVSHDLKSPLVTIRGFTQRLVRDAMGGRTDRLEHRSTRIDAAVDTMEALLDDLLQLSRVGRVADPTHSVPLGPLVDEVLLLLHGSLREAKATVLRNEPFPAVLGDPTRLREVLQNLIENAIRYRSEEPLVITLDAVRDGDEVELTVTDNGIGIDPAYHETVFGLFEQVHDGDGTGIGLALVRRIVDVHGGTVGVRSAPSRGSTFWVRLQHG